MSGKYHQEELNVYGAEGDEDMDAILQALDKAAAEPDTRRDHAE